MGLILKSSEVIAHITSLEGILNQNIDCYKKAQENIQTLVTDNSLSAESWEKMGNNMEISLRIVVEGILAAHDSIISDLNTLKSAVGSEDLNEDKINFDIKILEDECKSHINNCCANLLAKVGVNNVQLNQCDDSFISDRREQINILKEDLERLREINSSTSNLFDTAMDLLCAVSSIISDSMLIINGEVNGTDVHWGSAYAKICNTLFETKAEGILEDALKDELGVSLEEFGDAIGEETFKKIIKYMAKAGIKQTSFSDNSQLIADVLSAVSCSEVTSTEGKYQFKKSDGTEISYAAEELMEVLKGEPQFMDELEKQVYMKDGYNKDLLTMSQKMANAQYIYDALSDAGWSMEAICGILGNMEHESYLNPKIKNSSSGAYGLIQCNPAEDLTEYINKNYKNDNNKAEEISPEKFVDLSLQFIMDSSDITKTDVGNRWGVGASNKKPELCMDYNEFIESEEPAGKLALIFENQFERSGDSEELLMRRKINAEWWYEYYSLSSGCD